jgi:cob(I)alamin adenosyltransferase
MKIYTKKGDQGETGLFGGSRVPKDHARIQAYGTLDELNASLGMVLANEPSISPLPAVLQKNLIRIQGEIFQLGAELATPADKKATFKLISDDQISALEIEIDQMERDLPTLKSFILPGGTLRSSHLHLARTVLRRAERELVTLSRAENLRPEVMQYANRLGDYLFVCARWVSHQAGSPEQTWSSS